MSLNKRLCSFFKPSMTDGRFPPFYCFLPFLLLCVFAHLYACPQGPAAAARDRGGEGGARRQVIGPQANVR